MGRKLLNSELGRMSAEEFRKSEKGNFAVVIDNVRSQHNIGSAFRTCDAFRAAKMYICGISAVPPTAEIHKAALGAEFSVEWKYFGDTLSAIAELRHEGYTIVAVEQAENSISLDSYRPDPEKKYAFIFGNEVKGVMQEAVDMSDMVLEIPQFGTKHSLNISVSVGVILWDHTSKMISILNGTK